MNIAEVATPNETIHRGERRERGERMKMNLIEQITATDFRLRVRHWGTIAIDYGRVAVIRYNQYFSAHSAFSAVNVRFAEARRSTEESR